MAKESYKLQVMKKLLTKTGQLGLPQKGQKQTYNAMHLHP